MIHICDDFLTDPYTVRNHALKQKFITEEPFNYPGVRSSNIPSEIKDYISSYVNYITQKSSLREARYTGGGSFFQVMSKIYGDGQFHNDPHDYIFILYLSLDIPVDSGTEVCDYDHPAAASKLKDQNITGSYIDNQKRSFQKDPHNLIKRYRYARLKEKINSYFKPIVKVPNKFNRALFFPAHYYHRSQKSFGTSIANSRLTLVSFIDEIN